MQLFASEYKEIKFAYLQWKSGESASCEHRQKQGLFMSDTPWEVDQKVSKRQCHSF